MYIHVCMHTYYTYCRLINFNRNVFIGVQVRLNKPVAHAVSCTVQLAGSPFTKYSALAPKTGSRALSLLSHDMYTHAATI